MKRILAALLLIALLIYPIIHVTQFLNSPPSETWGYSRELVTYPDKTLKPFTPLEVVEEGEGYLAVYLNGKSLDLRHINSEGQVTDTKQIVHMVNSAWNIKVASYQNARLDLYLYGSDTLTYLSIDVENAKVLSEEVISEEVKHFDTEGETLAFATETDLVLLNKGQVVLSIPAEKVSELKVLESEHEVTVVYTLLAGQLVNKQLTYSLDKQVVSEREIENPQTHTLQTVVDLVKGENDYTALFLAKDKLGQKQRLTYTILSLNENGSQVKATKEEWWLRDGGKLIDSETVIVPVPTDTGIDYFTWNATGDINWDKRMTRERTMPNSPKYFEKGAYSDLLWISIESEGKVLKMTSTRSDFLIKEVTGSTYTSSAYVVFVSVIMSSMTTLIPMLILGAALMGILKAIDKKGEGKKQKTYLIIYYLIATGVLFVLFVTGILSKVGTLPLMPEWMNSSLILVGLFVISIILGAVVSKLLDLKETSIGPWPSALVHVLIIAVVYNSIIALYSPMLNILRGVI